MKIEKLNRNDLIILYGQRRTEYGVFLGIYCDNRSNTMVQPRFWNGEVRLYNICRNSRLAQN